MDDTKKQILGALEKANNILVTVSRNPSVDQLSAAIGLTLSLNKLGKHAIAVFSGEVPSTIEFLQPEKTLESNTDSLRDFIISLDKAKADKLRYKVEDDMVKIFITPYKTSLSQEDLQFSQGDFNVEVVMALGVHEQPELDQAITAHGRILHDATVVGVAVSGETRLGSINWVDSRASSLSEMMTGLVPKLKEGLLDNQIATAFLTGIVAETQRFSNDKTSPDTMQASSQLMAAGANQQLVATQLEQPEKPAQPMAVGDTNAAPLPKPREDGALEIEHEQKDQPPEEDKSKSEAPANTEIHIDEHGQFGPHPGEEQPEPKDSQAPEQSKDEPQEPTDEQQPSSRRPMALTPPVTGGKLTANSETEMLSPSVDVMGDGVTKSSQQGPHLSRRRDETKSLEPKTLSDIEAEVSSPHLTEQEAPEQQEALAEEPYQPPVVEPEPPVTPPEPPAPSPELVQPADTPPITPSPENPLVDARNAVMAAMDGHAQPKPTDLPADRPTEQASEQAPEEQPPANVEISPDGTLNVHPSENPEPYGPPAVPEVTDPTAPPEVPPPFMPPNYPPNNNPPQQ